MEKKIISRIRIMFKGNSQQVIETNIDTPFREFCNTIFSNEVIVGDDLTLRSSEIAAIIKIDEFVQDEQNESI